MSRWKCAICGRPTAKPALLIGEEAIGPVCARRAGLLKAAKSAGKRSRFRVCSHGPRAASEIPATGDLFEDANDA